MQPRVTQMLHSPHPLETAKELCVEVDYAVLIAGVPLLPCVLPKSEPVSSTGLLICCSVVALIQLNCKGETVLEIIVVVCFPKTADNPAVSSAGTWKLACELRHI